MMILLKSSFEFKNEKKNKVRYQTWIKKIIKSKFQQIQRHNSCQPQNKWFSIWFINLPFINSKSSLHQQFDLVWQQNRSFACRQLNIFKIIHLLKIQFVRNLFFSLCFNIEFFIVDHFSMTSVIYLDYNASTPVDYETVDQMMPFMKQIYGNPSSGKNVFLSLWFGNWKNLFGIHISLNLF